MTERVDCVVIGAGVVGLAVARACAQAGLETIVVEAATAIGTGSSSRNSEVIHAGIYYTQNSHKARLCVRGRDLLYAYCEAHGIAHQRCGKLIVATNEDQVGTLHRLQAIAVANGVTSIRLLDSVQARLKEPALRCVAALESPLTGIVDSHGLMLSLQGELESAGGMLAFCSTVTSGEVQSDEGIVLRIGESHPANAGASGDTAINTLENHTPSGEVMEIIARHVFNCAGLFAPAVAETISGIPTASIPKIRYAKGNYYALSGKAPFSRLIYPIPEPGGLGVHLTLDLGQRARFGPDVEWVEVLDYTVDPGRADGFYESIRRYWPDLPDNSLHPDYAGIRPKLQDLAYGEADFVIQGMDAHGVLGLVNLYGIESPGLTAALAIAEAALLTAGIDP